MADKKKKVKHLYALLVGINRYAGGVTNLYGCVHDVQLVEQTLKTVYAKREGFQLHIEVLTNENATYDNVVAGFRKHLCQADADSITYFHYSGHGSRRPSAEFFHREYPDGLDETLLLHDSRLAGKYELADKELAVLANEVTASGAHFTAVLDCCHSGSIFRDGYEEDEEHGEKGVREVRGLKDARPLHTYLDGYYTRAERKSIPSSNFINLSACAVNQVAKEDFNAFPGLRRLHGVFTVHLMRALEMQSEKLDYTRLFQQVRFSMASAGFRQCPQFESHGNFNTRNMFLSNKTAEQGKMFEVRYDSGLKKWIASGGKFQGIVEGMCLHVFESNSDMSFRKAIVMAVDANESVVETEQDDLNKKHVYFAQFGQSPTHQIAVYLDGAKNKCDSIKRWFREKQVQTVFFSEEPRGCRFMIQIRDSKYTLVDLERNKEMVTHILSSPKLYERLLETFNHLYRWHAIRDINHHDAQLGPQEVQIWFEIKNKKGEWESFDSSLIKLDFVREGSEWQYVPYRVRIKNNTNTPLSVRPFIIEEETFRSVAIDVFGLPPGETIELFDDYLGIQNEDDLAVTDYLKFVIATQDKEIDASQLSLSSIEPLLEPIAALSRSGGDKGLLMKKKVEESKLMTGVWVSRTLKINIRRRDNRLVSTPVALEGGLVQLRPHSAMTAEVSFASDRSELYRSERSPIANLPLGKGIEVVNLSGARTVAASLIELTNIQSPEAVSEDMPLQIDVSIQLEDDAYLVPIVTDGEDWIVLPHTMTRSKDAVELAVEHLPEIEEEFRVRSLGKALKMAFLKIVFGKKKVNWLQKIEFDADGSFERSDVMHEEVKVAKNIYVAVHGIIGDSVAVAEGIRLAIRQNGGDADNIEENLILTYDYENLNTSIESTADNLSSKLEAIGLHDAEMPKITMIVHSMGGLVTRTLLERNDKWHGRVNKVIFCGTPNGGSRFGKIPDICQVLISLASLALKFGGGGIGWLVSTVTALKSSKNINTTLTEMNIGSEFLTRLEESTDPKIEYHVIAGDLESYLRKTPEHRIKLLERIAVELGEIVYSNQPNDIAVAVESIKSIPNNRQPIPVMVTVPCHHLNYFVEEASLDALALALKT
ncbi:MAG: caspase family protein [Calditrichia bacterium]